MKSKLMTHYCMNRGCDWEETSHKIRDAIKCSSCDGLVMSFDPKVKSLSVAPNNSSNDILSDEIHEYRKHPPDHT